MRASRFVEINSISTFLYAFKFKKAQEIVFYLRRGLNLFSDWIGFSFRLRMWFHIQPSLKYELNKFIVFHLCSIKYNECCPESQKTRPILGILLYFDPGRKVISADSIKAKLCAVIPLWPCHIHKFYAPPAILGR